MADHREESRPLTVPTGNLPSDRQPEAKPEPAKAPVVSSWGLDQWRSVRRASAREMNPWLDAIRAELED